MCGIFKSIAWADQAQRFRMVLIGRLTRRLDTSLALIQRQASISFRGCGLSSAFRASNR